MIFVKQEKTMLKKIFDFIAGYNLVIHAVGILLLIAAGVIGCVMGHQYLAHQAKIDGNLVAVISAVGGFGVACIGIGQWKSV